MSYGQSRSRERSATTTAVSAVVAALIAGVAVAGVLVDTGLLGALADLYGIDGTLGGWALVFGHSLVVGAAFVAALTTVARFRYAPLPVVAALRSPFLGACLGVAYGTLLWLGVVAYGVPLWLEVVAGIPYPRPYRHLESYVALVWFGAVLGAWFPLVRTALTRD